MPGLFDSIPKHDYLNLYQGKQLRFNRITDLLNLKQDEVSNATGVPRGTIRYDQKMSQQLKERLNDLATLLNLVAGYFNGDQEKTLHWFATPNPMLGYISPRDMIVVGRFNKLLKFVYNALAENKT
jgi:uncharacterized protein (DUF2384 family)